MDGISEATARLASAGSGLTSLAGRPLRTTRTLAARAGLAVLDSALRSPYADEAVAHVLESPLAERAVESALSGRLVDATSRDLVRFEVAERLASRLLEGPGLGRVVDMVLESPIVDDAVARIAEDVIARIRTSEAMWALVDDIAQSPSVSAAITQQSAGLADQMAVEIRERSRTADDRLERAARRVLHRRQRPGGDRMSPAT